MRLWSFDRWTAATPLRNHARAAVRNGFAVVFLRPGGKEPLCPLTARERKKAGPHHACGVAHASKDETWVLRKAKMLVEAHGQINLGIAAHASGVVVIDADTPEQVESVSDFLRELGEDAAILADQPTVRTPGAQRNGVWVHAQGTHWYFNRPDELELPEYPGHMVLTGGAVMRWGNSYTLVPPSERAEGPYVSLAECIADVPVGLSALIRDHVHRRLDAAVDLMSRFHDDRIVEWSIRTPWHTLLEPDGWSFMGKLDRQCGCPVWRRPGDDTSTDRSAIAHEDDCGQMANVEGHGALHIFSDNPPGLLAERVAAGQRTFTKLQYVALMHHDGDETAAKVALGIEADYDSWDPSNPRIPESQTPSSGDSGTRSDQGFRDGEPGPADPDGDPSIDDLIAAPGSPLIGLPRDIQLEVIDYDKRRIHIPELAKQWSSFKASGGVARITKYTADQIPRRDMEATICARRDGVFTLYPRRVSSIYGPSDSGKSWYALYAVVDTATKGMVAMYIDIEDDEDGFAYRLDTIGVPLEVQSRIIYRRLWYPPTDAELGEIMRESRHAKLIAIDSADALLTMLGIDTNANGAVRSAGNILKRLGRAGAAVLIVDHATEKNRPGERSESPIGSSAKKAFVDGVMLRADRMSLWVPGQVCETMIMLGKDRHSRVRANVEHDGTGNVFGRFAKLRLEPPLAGSIEAGDMVSRLTLEVPPSYTDSPEGTPLSSDELAAVESGFLGLVRDNEWHTRTELLTAGGDKNGRNGLGGLLDKWLADFAAVIETESTPGVAGRTNTRYRFPPSEETS